MKQRFESDGMTTYGLLVAPTLDAATIGALGDAIRELVPALAAEQQRTGDDFVQIGIEVGPPATRLSEWSVWSAVLDRNDGHRIVAAYVDEWCNRVGKHDLPWTDEKNPVGSIPLRESLLRDKRGRGVIETLARFIRHCDMGHETWQFDAVRGIFADNMHDDLSSLFAARCFGNGQHDHDFLRSTNLFFRLHLNAPLRRVLDHAIGSERGTWISRGDIELLLAAVCGTDVARRGRIEAYIERLCAERAVKLEAGHAFEADVIAELRATADKAMGGLRHLAYDSGFDRRVDGVWVPVEP